MERDLQFEQAIHGLTLGLKKKLSTISDGHTKCIHEVRIRQNSPICVTIGTTALFLGKDGALQTKPDDTCVITTKEEMEASFISLCNYSVHTHQNELNQGFISLSGGHRVGLGATAIYNSASEIKNVRAVTSYVIRISRTVENVATPIIQQTLSNGLTGILIVGPPSSGKTTILCDLARQLSTGTVLPACAVSIIDERGELSPRILGHAGINCELLSGYSKADGIITAVRSLAPSIIICDEIGGKNDVDYIIWALNCGVPIVTTIHGRSYQEIMHRPTGKMLIESGSFEYAVILESANQPCKIKEVIHLDECLHIHKDSRDYLHPL